MRSSSPTFAIGWNSSILRLTNEDCVGGVENKSTHPIVHSHDPSCDMTGGWLIHLLSGYSNYLTEYFLITISFERLITFANLRCFLARTGCAWVVWISSMKAYVSPFPSAKTLSNEEAVFNPLRTWDFTTVEATGKTTLSNGPERDEPNPLPAITPFPKTLINQNRPEGDMVLTLFFTGNQVF